MPSSDLALHSGAYLAEIFYSAFYSVPKGQIEASQVIGLSTYRTVKNIILPQAPSPSPSP